MVKLDANNWYRLEGYIIPTTEYNYSTPITNLNGIDIWYTNVEIQLQNPTVGNYVHGVSYKTRKFSDYGFTTIEEINDNFATTLDAMLNDMKDNEGALTYVEPFTIEESSVICYGDSYDTSLTKYIVILKDDSDVRLSSITVSYDGPAVAMDEPFDNANLNVIGHYNDGHTSEFIDGAYTVTRSDGVTTNVVNKIGSNLFTITVTESPNQWSATVVIPGVKRLTGITATYSGPDVAMNKSPKRKHIVVVADYSDGSASTVTDWIFSDGDTVTSTNLGILNIYYQGFECPVTINYYDAYPSQIKAFYNGPKVEIGKDFLMSYLTVKIYYQDNTNTNFYWEVLDPIDYTISTQTILHEKDNIITVTYVTSGGIVLTTNFIVEGFYPENEILYIAAEYVGPPIMQGKTYNPLKVICKAYWSDSSVTVIKDFTVSSTLVEVVGPNEIFLSYKDHNCIFIVTGVDPESTTESGYSPTEINLLYPEASRVNHRRRGPMESEKFDAYSKFVYDNITNLYSVYNSLEKQYKTINKNTNNLHNVGINALNTCSTMDKRIRILNGRR